MTSPAMVVVNGCGIMFLMQGNATYTCIRQPSKIPKTCLRDYLCSLHCSTAPVPYYTTVVCLSASARSKSSPTQTCMCKCAV